MRLGSLALRFERSDCGTTADEEEESKNSIYKRKEKSYEIVSGFCLGLRENPRNSTEILRLFVSRTLEVKVIMSCKNLYGRDCWCLMGDKSLGTAL